LQKEDNVVIEFPFDSERKRTLTVVRLPGDVGIRVYIKGAPEFVVGMSSKTYTERGALVELNKPLRHKIFDSFTMDSKNKLKPLAFAFRDMDMNEFNDLAERTQGFSRPESKQLLEQNMTFVGYVGFKNEIRKSVSKTITMASKSKTNIIMISGDHQDVTMNIALEAGIINPT
jgi:magnesium-transporting ATPase (P-type)